EELEVGNVAVRVSDPVEELGADDAAAAPDLRHGAEVDVPAVLVSASSDGVEALRIRDDLRRVQGEANVFDERVVVLDPPGVARARKVGCRLPLLGVRRQAAREYGFGDAGDRYAEVEGCLHRPDAGALGT